MPDLLAQPAFGHLRPVGRADAGVRAAERGGLGLASLLARRGRAGALRERVRALHGLDLPDDPRIVASDAVSFIATAPGAWLAVTRSDAIAAMLTQDLAGLASVSDQSGGTAVLTLSGPRVRDALAKGFAIDLHPSRFAPGAAAVTQAAHIGVILWRMPGDDPAAPAFHVAVARSYAADFRHWLSDSAAEYGFAAA